jgi:centromeric protein E
MSDKIKVAMKVRHLISREEFGGQLSQWELKNNSFFQKYSIGKYGKSYTFDHVFDRKTNNYELFNTVARPIIHSSVSGFNGTISAYGQTSSGKTYNDGKST